MESRPISSLRCDPNNARRHDPPNLEAIRASLERFGQQKPIVVTADGRVVAGNGTLEAARALGWSEIDVVVTDLDGAAATAYALADNRTAELAEWDDEALQAALREVAAHADLLDATGFDVGDIEIEIDEDLDAEPQIERADELQAVWKTDPGQLWQLGAHRLLCGDSTKREDVERLLAGETINVGFTSPPYASQRKYDESSGFKPIHPDDFVAWFDSVQTHVAAHLAPDGSWLVNIKEHCDDGQRSLYVKDLVIAHVRAWGWCFIDEFAWTKSGVPGKWPNRFKNAWEPVFHFARGAQIKMRHENVGHASDDLIDYHPDNPKTHSGFISSGGGGQGRRTGTALPSNVLAIHNSAAQTDTGDVKHPATFPVGLPLFFIKAFSDEGDVIYEPFTGSGTTLVAAEQLGRRCRALEISPGYVAVALQRWADATGKTPELLT